MPTGNYIDFFLYVFSMYVILFYSNKMELNHPRPGKMKYVFGLSITQSSPSLETIIIDLKIYEE